MSILPSTAFVECFLPSISTGMSFREAQVIACIEHPENNLVNWPARYGAEDQPHAPLHQAKSQPGELRKLEKAFFKLYRTQNDEESFSDFVAIFGKRYPLLAYLFFLKDRSKYLPIRPTHFDRVFELLGVDLKTSHRCSWENYRDFIQVLSERRTLLSEQLNVEVSLLDAHSFAWILSSQMQRAGKLANVEDYLSLPASEREAIVMARIGQGRFRSQLLDYWSGCAVTGCREPKFLRASHIKPWSKSSLQERTDLFNGLLLSPALDTAFDAGFITFDENGRILISDLLSNEDASALGIHPEMRIRELDNRHGLYLDHHRTEIFKDGGS